MVRKIYIVLNGRYSPKPVMAFSDENEACDFAVKLHDKYYDDDYRDNIVEVQLVEGSIIDELLRGLECKLDREGIEITGVEFEGDNA